MTNLLTKDTFTAFITGMNKKKKAKPELSSNHYPKQHQFHCTKCTVPTLHYLIEGIGTCNGYKNISSRTPFIGYNCELCKNAKIFKYCPPHRKLKFEILRGI